MMPLLSNTEAITALFVIGLYHAFTSDDDSANASFTYALQLSRVPAKRGSLVNSRN